MKHDYTQLKKEVLKANLELVRRGLVIYTWGNVSQIDRINGVIAIKPRGIEYSDLDVDDISIVDLQGNIVQGVLLPSVDLPIHLELYKAFENIGGIAHTHSTYATIYAQSLKSHSCLWDNARRSLLWSCSCARVFIKKRS